MTIRVTRPVSQTGLHALPPRLTRRGAGSTIALATEPGSPMPRSLSSANSFRSAACLLLLLLNLSAPTWAEKTDQLKPQGYVNDFAGVLSAAAKAQLTALCGEVQQKTGAQIALVTVKTLDGVPVEEYSVDLATKWGIGPKKSERGVMILFAIDDRRSRVEVGYGLEPILPDGKTGSFLREAIPQLQQGDYDGALLLVTRRVADVIAADAGVTLSGNLPVPRRSGPQESPGWSLGEILVLLFVIFVVYSILKGSGGGRYTRGGPGSGWWIGPMIGGSMGGGWGGGRGGWGGGGFGGGGGGGGFGGFGGGSFGGGGASGSW